MFYSFYSQVAGGLLSDEFLGKPWEDVTLDTSSKRKYASVLGYAGGYKWFQTLLETLRTIGDKHGGQTISNVAARWVCLVGVETWPRGLSARLSAAHLAG